MYGTNKAGDSDSLSIFDDLQLFYFLFFFLTPQITYILDFIGVKNMEFLQKFWNNLKLNEPCHPHLQTSNSYF